MIRVFVAFDGAVFGQRPFEYLNEQPDFQVCGIVELGDEAVREASALRPGIAILEIDNFADLVVANAFKQQIAGSFLDRADLESMGMRMEFLKEYKPERPWAWTKNTC